MDLNHVESLRDYLLRYTRTMEMLEHECNSEVGSSKVGWKCTNNNTPPIQ